MADFAASGVSIVINIIHASHGGDKGNRIPGVRSDNTDSAPSCPHSQRG